MIKQRILQYLDFKGISKYEFYKKTSFSNGFLDKEGNIGSDKCEKICYVFPDIDLKWLITGNGDMLITGKQEKEALYVAEDRPHYGNLKPIPLVSQKAVGGFGNHSFAVEEKDVKEYYVVPKFKHKKIDFMIEVEGPSMYPKYNSGDVVACTIIKENSFIQWHKVHVVATLDQGIIIKRIEPSQKENYLTMMSDNEKYKPFDVPREEITGIALVVGVIRLE